MGQKRCNRINGFVSVAESRCYCSSLGPRCERQRPRLQVDGQGVQNKVGHEGGVSHKASYGGVKGQEYIHGSDGLYCRLFRESTNLRANKQKML